LGEEENKSSENERQCAQDQEEAKIGLPAGRDALWLIQVKVVGKEQSKERDASYLGKSILVHQLDVPVIESQDRSGRHGEGRANQQRLA
jgi:hypothetical protein